MTSKPAFPTVFHQDAAEVTRDYFSKDPRVDTILLVNSCARGIAVPESDLDFAILVSPGTATDEINKMGIDWQAYELTRAAITNYKQSGPYAHLHLDIITGQYAPGILGNGEPSDYFEIEIGNQVCYSLPMNDPGPYFTELRRRWLPYYPEALRLQRFILSRNACQYHIDHIPRYVKRGLYFHAFDILCKAFQDYLQTLFIANKTYPIAYNKWIEEQIVKWLRRPALYPRLSPILSVCNIESDEMNQKANMLNTLLNEI